MYWAGTTTHLVKPRGVIVFLLSESCSEHVALFLKLCESEFELRDIFVAVPLQRPTQ